MVVFRGIPVVWVSMVLPINYKLYTFYIAANIFLEHCKHSGVRLTLSPLVTSVSIVLFFYFLNEYQHVDIFLIHVHGVFL